MRRIVMIGLIGLFALVGPAVLSGCSQADRTYDASGTIVLDRGQKATISLRENPTTSFLWVVTQEPASATAKVTRNWYAGDSNPGLQVGVGGTEHWEVAGVAKGTTTMVMQLRRGSEVSDTATFDITVR